MEPTATDRTSPWQAWALAALVGAGSAASQLLRPQPTTTGWVLGGCALVLVVLAAATAVSRYRTDHRAR